MGKSPLIVVASQSEVFGPFADADEALEWLTQAKRSITISEWPLVIHVVESPDRYRTKIAERVA